MGRDRREREGCMELIKTYCIHVMKISDKLRKDEHSW